MDLSGLKWPLIIVVVVFFGWLGTSGGVNWMVNNFTQATPGVDLTKDATDEAGLSKVATYLTYLWRYERAAGVLETMMERYPHGAHYWYGMYRLSTCYERMGMYQEAYNLLNQLIDTTANSLDDRIPENDNLSLKAAKLRETHELQ